MNEKITVIMPNNAILEYARDVVQKNSYDAELIFDELDGAIQHVQKQLTKEFRVYVSRGGTARRISERFSLPVVEIAVSGHDILETLYPHVNSELKIAVIGFDNVIAGAKRTAAILGIDIGYLETHTAVDVQNAIQNARDVGIDLIIGDYYVERKAAALGLRAERIESGPEAVRLALEEAARLYSATVAERTENRRYSVIMESIEEGVIVINEQGNVTLFNPAAEKIWSIAEQDALGEPIDSLIPQTYMLGVLQSGEELVDNIMDLGKIAIASSVKPIIVDGKVEGVVSTFRDITKIQQLETKIRSNIVKKRLHAKKHFGEIIHSSVAMRDILEQAKKYAVVDSTILIFGESGTGKEIMAQALHNGSLRVNDPFVAVNCAALPDSLLESELFGYVEGSFTGAKKEGKKGLFEMAHGGTIFLDEISEMSLNVQARILRVIQEKEVMRLGDDKIVPVDVRILAATNKSLWQCVQDGVFRRDLFYRLNVLNLNLPSLRERTEDVEPLSRMFIAELSGKYNVAPPGLDQNDVASLRAHRWPGNVRELQNIIERYIISGKIRIDEFSDIGEEDENLIQGTLRDIESRLVRKVLEEEDFCKNDTAKRLGISRTTLDKIIRR